MKHSESIAVIAEALAKAQLQLKDTAKSKQGYGYKYADLSDVLSAIRSEFGKQGLSFTQEVTQEGKVIKVTTLLMHSSGEWIVYGTAIPSIIMKGCNDAQSAGAGITYARRYAISAIAGIASEEDTDATTEVPAKTSVAHKAVKPPKPAKTDNWIKSFLKTMSDIKTKLGEEDYYNMLSEYADVEHANEIKSKEVAQKVYKAMSAKVKLEENKKKLKEKADGENPVSN